MRAELLLRLVPAAKRDVIRILSTGEFSVSQLSEQMGISASGVWQHVSDLANAGVVRSRSDRRGKGRPTMMYSLVPEMMA